MHPGHTVQCNLVRDPLCAHRKFARRISQIIDYSEVSAEEWLRPAMRASPSRSANGVKSITSRIRSRFGASTVTPRGLVESR